MRILLGLVIVLNFSQASFAETRAAFIVGNSSYENAVELENPVNDARLISKALTSVGFDVTTHNNLTRAEFGQSLSAFLTEQEDTDVILFYFAGHGMQLDGENLLLGTDASLRSEFDVLAESIPISAVAEALRRRAKSVLILIDACRDNPIATNFFAQNFPQSRSLETRGLARVSSPAEGTMYFFAASPRQVAYDGIGRNSPFSLALARHLPTPGLEILTMTKRVIADVRVLTNGRQNPTVTNDIASEIFLAGLEAQAQQTTPSLEEQAASSWVDFRGSTSPEALEAFAEAYPNTAYAALAASAALSLRKENERAHSVQPLELPNWCAATRSETEAFICRDPELIDMHEQVAALHDERLANVRSGEARGQALVDQRNWRVSRDKCKVDRSCVAQSYRLRVIALDEFSGERPPKALVVRSIQEELNRLSCGAGEPDGVLGGRTTRAYALASSLSTKLDAEAPLDTLQTLASLRGVRSAICSYLSRAVDNPSLLTGIWRVEIECPNERNGRIIRTFRLSFDGGGTYSGAFAFGSGGDFSRAIGGRLADQSLSLLHVTPNGGRQIFSFEPSPDPDKFTGYDHNRCNLSVTR